MIRVIRERIKVLVRVKVKIGVLYCFNWLLRLENKELGWESQPLTLIRSSNLAVTFVVIELVSSIKSSTSIDFYFLISHL